MECIFRYHIIIRWTMKQEQNKGNVIKHKAMLVAHGFSQKFGVDYDEVFPPVVRTSTFRMLLAIVRKKKLQVYH